jgi:hypothetical protein
VSIDVRVWILGLSVLGQDAWGNLVDLADQLEHRVLWQFAQSELSLGNIARIGLAEDSMAVAGYDTARIESIPEVLGDVGVAKVGANSLLHLREPVEHFLVGTVVLLAFILEMLNQITYRPWRGPARPLRPAERDSIGELSALPTKCVVWALTFPPS